MATSTHYTGGIRGGGRSDKLMLYCSYDTVGCREELPICSVMLAFRSKYVTLFFNSIRNAATRSANACQAQPATHPHHQQSVLSRATTPNVWAPAPRPQQAK